jgi:hypothetical protein
MVDELKDVSKKELLGVSLRYVVSRTIKETTLGLIELEDLGANAIATAVDLALRDAHIDPGKCVGIASDGAAVMSGARGGVQALLRERVMPGAIYVHCAAHRLNLVLVKAAKALSPVLIFWDAVEAVANFFHAATRHSKLLEVQQRRKEVPMEIPRPNDTRWLSRHGAVRRIQARLASIVEALEAVAERREDRLVAEGLRSALMSKDFVYQLVMWSELLGYMEAVTTALQSPRITTEDANRFVVILCNNLRSMQNVENWKKLEAAAEAVCDEHGVEAWTRRPKRLKVEGREGETPTDSFRRDVLLPTLARLLEELDGRFQANQSPATACIQAFLDCDASAAEGPALTLAEQWGINLDAIQVQQGISYLDVCPLPPRESRNLLDLLVPGLSVFPELEVFIHALAALPVTTCSTERLFSTVARVKTRLRSTMVTGRLEALAILCAEDVIEADFDGIIDVFKNAKKRRLDV